MKSDNIYQNELRKHYQKVIQPSLLRHVKRDKLLFDMSIMLLFGVAFLSLIQSNKPFAILAYKALLGISAWSLCFMCIHVSFHVHMWKNRRTLTQKTFPFYHHYVDPLLYSTHKKKYQAAHLDALTFIIIPAMYIDNIMGSVMLTAGLIDVYTHQWYHTQRDNRIKDFNFIQYKLLAFLELMGVINTKKHLRIHHNHGVNQLDQVTGWMDVSWPIIGKICNYLGNFCYRFGKAISFGEQLTWGANLLILFTTYLLTSADAERSYNLYLVIIHCFVAFATWLYNNDLKKSQNSPSIDVL